MERKVLEFLKNEISEESKELLSQRAKRLRKKDIEDWLRNNFYNTSPLDKEIKEKKEVEQKLVVYTDGSAIPNPGKGGWAYRVKLGSKVLKEGSGGQARATNNEMELTAALEALRNTKGDITLYTDSMYLIDCINKYIKNWVKNGWKTAKGKDVMNKELWQSIYSETKGRKVDWRYVKAHNGDPDNERVDQLAKQAGQAF